MNDKFTDMNPEDAELADKLNTLSERTSIDPRFADKLEHKLQVAHTPKTSWWIPSTNSILPSLGWVALVVMAGLLLIWSIQNLIPAPQPASENTPVDFTCPVTEPNGSLPPGETVESLSYLGNDQLWTSLWPDGRVYMTPINQADDGSFSLKWAWWRGVSGQLAIEGHRLDAEAEPLRFLLTEGYGDVGIQPAALIFPTTGCWEVTGRVGDASLTFVTEVLFGIATPIPDGEVLIEKSATPVPDGKGYDWRNTKLYLNVPLPQSPTDAKLYSLNEEQPANIETVTALAANFGIQGDIYETPSILPDQIGYLVTDGKQRLYIQSEINFSYYADYPAYSYMSGGKNITDEQAAAVIDAFLKSHGLDFPYRLEYANLNPGVYYVLPLTTDGLPIYHDYNIPSRLEFTVGDNGQVILMTSYRVGYNATDGTYGIRTAEEAFQQVLGQSDTIQNGVLEIMRSGGGPTDSGFWSHTYPDNETVTIYGQPLSYPAAETGGAPFIAIGQFTATGNISGIENVDSTTYVEATGQFVTENGIRRFVVDSWKVTTATEAYLSGSLRREGDQTLLTADDGSGEYVIEEAPADLPLNTTIPDDYLAIHGFMAEGRLIWDSIQFYPDGSAGGGGGGGGNGFYQLNLSGTPVPFPTPSSTTNQETGEYIVKAGDTLSGIASSFGVTVDELMQANNITDPGLLQIDQKLVIPGVQPTQSPVGMRLEAQRGIVQVNIYKKADGSQRVEYGFFNLDPTDPAYYLLEGPGLQELQKYHNLPIDIWGTVTSVDSYGKTIAQVERFEIPFPDLRFQIIKGKQRLTEVNGEPVLLFTSDEGTTYIELTTVGTPADSHSMVGKEGDEVIMEALIIPGETVGGYPGLRSFSSAMASNPKDGQAMEMTVTADQPYVMDEAPATENHVPPTATIEKVELVYYIPDPTYGKPDPNGGAQYIQPAWRFYGHYDNGDEFEFLVQALKQEFLLPELAPYRSPG